MQISYNHAKGYVKEEEAFADVENIKVLSALYSALPSCGHLDSKGSSSSAAFTRVLIPAGSPL